MAVREQLAELLEGEEDWAGAAKVLAGIDLDSGQCCLMAPTMPEEHVNQLRHCSCNLLGLQRCLIGRTLADYGRIVYSLGRRGQGPRRHQPGLRSAASLVSST